MRSAPHDATKDAADYRDCLEALQRYSPEAGVFLLVHTTDSVTGDRTALLERRMWELQAESGAVSITVIGTNIHDETLYKVRCLVPTVLSPFPLSLRVPGLMRVGVVEESTMMCV